MTNYEKNIKVLKSINPFLYEDLEKCTKPKWFEKINSKDGSANFLIKNNTKTMSAYAIDFPRREPKAFVKVTEYHKENITVLIGSGLGHLLKPILVKKEKKHQIIVVDPVVWMIKSTFEQYDVSKWMVDGTLTFLHKEKDVLLNLGAIEQLFIIQEWLVIAEKYTIHTEEYIKMTQHVMDTINQIRCNTGTVMGAGAEIGFNDINNLPYCLRHRGVDELKDIYKNKPAIIICTGPSLQKNIHLLMNKEVRKNIIIIAVAQALRVLLAYDIKPDFICTVDFGKVNYCHFEDLMNSDVPLIALNRSYHKILREYSGPKFIAATNSVGFEDTAAGMLMNKGFLEAGGSVAHFSVGLGIKMGCNPIMIIGQDLSFGEKSHIATVDAGGDVFVENDTVYWKVTDPKSHLYGTVTPQGPAKYVPGYFGEDVLTNIGLLSFITSFNTIMKTYPDIEFINCTEGGAKIEEAQQMSLEKALSTYCKKEIDKDIVKPKLTLIDNYIDKMKYAVELLNSEIKDLKEIIVSTKNGIRTGEEILNADIKDKNTLNRLLIENQKHSSNAENLTRKNCILGIAIFKATRDIHTRQYSTTTAPKNLVNNEDDLYTRVARNQLILKEAKDWSVKLLKVYSTSLNTLKEYIKTKDEKILINPPESACTDDTLEECLYNKNWAYPYLMLKDTVHDSTYYKARNMRAKSIIKMKKEYNSKNTDDIITYNDYIDIAHKAGREEKDFIKATNYLKKAVKLIPTREVGLWGLATALHHIGKVDKSLKAYQNLIKEYPDNLRYQYEYASVLTLKDTPEALKLMGEVMAKTDEFNDKLLSLAHLWDSIGELQKAVSAAEIYLELFPGNYLGWDYLSKLYTKSMQSKKAKKAQKRALTLKPK